MLSVSCCSVECCCKDDDDNFVSSRSGGADNIDRVENVGVANGGVVSSNKFYAGRSQASIQHIRIPLGDKKPVKFR